MKTGNRQSAIGMMVLVAGCSSLGGVRPRYQALPESERVMLSTPAATVIQEVEQSVREAGLAVAHSAPREGYLETEWFNAATRSRASAPFNDPNIVKLRFFADPEQGQTRLLAESVVRTAWDPSVPQRELERMAPMGHAGRALLDSLVGVAIARQNSLRSSQTSPFQ